MRNESVIVVRCETCTYRLAYPAFFLEAAKPKIRKIFKLLYRYDWQNREAIDFLEKEFPEFAAMVETQGRERVAKFAQKLQDRTADYEREFLDPDPATFPPGMTKDQIRSERQSRKDWNAVRKQQVKNAKANYERAKIDAISDFERAKQIYELFLSEKRKN